MEAEGTMQVLKEGRNQQFYPDMISLSPNNDPHVRSGTHTLEVTKGSLIVLKFYLTREKL